MESKDKVTVLGTPGGTRIITMVLLGILGYDDGLDAQQVAALPRYHHQWMPDEIGAETDAFTPEVVKGLRAMGHPVEVPGEEEIGRASCRERVCQYVYVVVDAVYLKKTTLNT